MIILQYDSSISLNDMEKELFDKCREAGVIDIIPTVFHFEGCVESKLFSFWQPSKLAEMVHRNIQVFADSGWNAVLHIDEIGFVHVFFGLNRGEVIVPDIFNHAIQGTC